ncbi:MAG: hypothetical protein HC774_05540 [Sphingomonadales bacterium]|nr:hypothetical protein [Sphingomonadales bacterium]
MVVGGQLEQAGIEADGIPVPGSFQRVDSPQSFDERAVAELEAFNASLTGCQVHIGTGAFYSSFSRLGYRIFGAPNGDSPERIALVEKYCKAQGMFASKPSPDPVFTDTLELDLSAVVSAMAGPNRPEKFAPLADIKNGFQSALDTPKDKAGFAKPGEGVIIVAGVPLGSPGTTNMVRIAHLDDQGNPVAEGV